MDNNIFIKYSDYIPNGPSDSLKIRNYAQNQYDYIKYNLNDFQKSNFLKYLEEISNDIIGTINKGNLPSEECNNDKSFNIDIFKELNFSTRTKEVSRDSLAKIKNIRHNLSNLKKDNEKTSGFHPVNTFYKNFSEETRRKKPQSSSLNSEVEAEKFEQNKFWSDSVPTGREITANQLESIPGVTYDESSSKNDNKHLIDSKEDDYAQNSGSTCKEDPVDILEPKSSISNLKSQIEDPRIMPKLSENIPHTNDNFKNLDDLTKYDSDSSDEKTYENEESASYKKIPEDNFNSSINNKFDSIKSFDELQSIEEQSLDKLELRSQISNPKEKVTPKFTDSGNSNEVNTLKINDENNSTDINRLYLKEKIDPARDSNELNEKFYNSPQIHIYNNFANSDNLDFRISKTQKSGLVETEKYEADLSNLNLYNSIELKAEPNLLYRPTNDIPNIEVKRNSKLPDFNRLKESIDLSGLSLTVINYNI